MNNLLHGHASVDVKNRVADAALLCARLGVVRSGHGDGVCDAITDEDRLEVDGVIRSVSVQLGVAVKDFGGEVRDVLTT